MCPPAQRTAIWIARADKEGIVGYKAIEAFFREMDTLRQQYPSQSPS